MLVSADQGGSKLVAISDHEARSPFSRRQEISPGNGLPQSQSWSIISCESLAE
jgi:hypothetical protein